MSTLPRITLDEALEQRVEPGQFVARSSAVSEPREFDARKVLATMAFHRLTSIAVDILEGWLNTRYGFESDDE